MHLLPQFFGSRSEDLAAAYLINKGFTILQRNYRYKRGEIDIIAKIKKLLIFVEVKARSNVKFGYPEAFVDCKKQKRLCTIAEHYIIHTAWSHAIRFDIISIVQYQGAIQITHIEDAFY